jgi:hypothetical protein
MVVAGEARAAPLIRRLPTIRGAQALTAIVLLLFSSTIPPMPGAPDRFELSVAERLRPVIFAIGKRMQRADERRWGIMGDLRGLTPEESANLQAGWQKVHDA